MFSRHQVYLSGREWIELLRKIKLFARYVRITGGECTLHPDFEAIVSHLDSFDIPYAIFTNGVWHNSEELLSFFSRLKNLNSLLVSLHGPDPTTHDRFTGSHYFALTIENIRRATAAGLTVDTNTVFTRDNYQKIEATVKLSAKLGARCAVFSRYYGALTPVPDLDDAQLAQGVRSVETLRAEGYATKLNPCIPQCFVSSSSRSCGAGMTLCTVDPSGNVRPCNHAPVWLGNLMRMDMPTIWSCAAATEWRMSVPESCFSCTAWSICGGGCRATGLHRKLTTDPVMRSPISARLPETRRVYAGMRAVVRFQVRREPTGALLIRLNRVMRVSARGLQIAEALDGGATLADIDRLYGQEALQFVMALFQQGLVELGDKS